MTKVSNVANLRRQAIEVGVLEAIRERRTIGRVKSDPVEREIIEDLLLSASWAPSHHNTQPWRFVVMTGEGRSKLGEGYARVTAASSGIEGNELEDRLKKERSKAYRAPVVIAAICSPADDPRAVYAEELAATQAAVQNLLLAAHAYGLGAIWRSGAPMFDPLMKDTFELRADEEIVGFIYLGYPDMKALAAQRTPVENKTLWLES
ncbi:nitroreductase [Paenibacillus sp. L3-i20]|uniref:nitroreductase family protein n=1 Tax=Paenibacillus sp. L3-i20 TaxID=2905833 RepID=UPI001EDDB2C1|nr:nitroreductase [Paenibacillus sp. L3-i20]